MRQVEPCPLSPVPWVGEVMEVNLVSDRLLPEQETLVAEDAPILSKYQLQIEKANERLRKAEERLLKAKIALKEIKMFWDLG
jgi:hypothetical protein